MPTPYNAALAALLIVVGDDEFFHRRKFWHQQAHLLVDGRHTAAEAHDSTLAAAQVYRKLREVLS